MRESLVRGARTALLRNIKEKKHVLYIYLVIKIRTTFHMETRGGRVKRSSGDLPNTHDDPSFFSSFFCFLIFSVYFQTRRQEKYEVRETIRVPL